MKNIKLITLLLLITVATMAYIEKTAAKGTPIGGITVKGVGVKT